MMLKDMMATQKITGQVFTYSKPVVGNLFWPSGLNRKRLLRLNRSRREWWGKRARTDPAKSPGAYLKVSTYPNWTLTIILYTLCMYWYTCYITNSHTCYLLWDLI